MKHTILCPQCGVVAATITTPATLATAPQMGDVRRFVKERCRLDQKAETAFSDLYRAYVEWADAPPFPAKRFSAELSALPNVEPKRTSKQRMLAGIRLRG